MTSENKAQQFIYEVTVLVACPSAEAAHSVVCSKLGLDDEDSQCDYEIVSIDTAAEPVTQCCANT